MGGEGRPPRAFLKIENVLILKRKAFIVSMFRLSFPFKNFVLRVSAKKTAKCFPAGPLFLLFLTKWLLKCSSSTKPLPPLPWKISGCTSPLMHYSFCKTLRLKCLTVFWISLCLDNCSLICTVTICYVLHQTHWEFWHIQNCWFRGGGLQVYILVSEIFSKNNFSNLSITIIILETVTL